MSENSTLGTQVESRGLVIQKYLRERQQVGIVGFAVELARSIPVAVRFADRLPPDTATDAVRIHPDHQPRNSTVDGDRVYFEVVVDPDETTTIKYGVRGESSTPQIPRSDPEVIDITSLGGLDADPDDAVELFGTSLGEASSSWTELNAEEPGSNGASPPDAGTGDEPTQGDDRDGAETDARAAADANQDGPSADANRGGPSGFEPVPSAGGTSADDATAADLTDTTAADRADTTAADRADTTAADRADTTAADRADTTAADRADTTATDRADDPGELVGALIDALESDAVPEDQLDRLRSLLGLDPAIDEEDIMSRIHTIEGSFERLETRIAGEESTTAEFRSEVTDDLANAEQQLVIIEQQLETVTDRQDDLAERIESGDVGGQDENLRERIEELGGDLQNLQDEFQSELVSLREDVATIEDTESSKRIMLENRVDSLEAEFEEIQNLNDKLRRAFTVSGSDV